MNQDVELNDQKVKPPPELKVDLDFVTSINDRQIGFIKRNHFSSVQINATAEDELVKKQYKEKYCELPGVPRSTFLMEFSPDGTKVASTHGNHHIYVTDVRTGKHIKTLIGHPRTPWCIAFHPTSNQIIASGCLGGQVRIWDLSGGSEVWTAETPSVIASIAFHPDDRLLVIATFNELFFWDWSKPEPFIHVSTASVKEKVRYVAFDKLGHKLITGITNSPQTRWERVRTVPVSVSVPVPAETRPTGPCPRRIARRVLAPRFNWPAPIPNPPTLSGSSANQEPLSSVPERERRITSCYRELVHQYEVLVHRYLQIYRRPIMIDQGTDPMEIEPNSQQSSSTSQSNIANRPSSPIPSTSGTQRQPRKSSGLHPPKNRNRRILYQTDSAGSSSSSSSPENKGKTSGGTQTGDGQDTSGTVTKKEEKGKSGGSSSSSDVDDDDSGFTTKNQKNLYMPSISGVGSSSYSNTTTFTSARQLKLTGLPLPPRNVSGTGNAHSDNEEDAKYKMRIKSFIAPITESVNANASKLPVNTTSAGTSTSSLSPKENINHLINNAKLMLAKYRETLQQRGLQIRGVDLPDLEPSTSLQQSGSSNKPSKGTNTNEIECPPKRKRRLLRPNLLGNILFTSSEDSSSDNEPQVKVPCSSRNQQDDVSPGELVSNPPSETNAASSEHSYADVPGQCQSVPGIKTNAQKRKRRLVKSNDNEATTNEVSANRVEASSIPNTSTETSTTPSDSLMDRQVQRLVVESLSVLDGPSTSDNVYNNPHRPNDPHDSCRLCGSCGGQLDGADTPSIEGCARTATVCTRLHAARRITSSSGVPPTTPPLDRARRRFLSHRLSAFHPTRLLSRMLRDRAGSSSSRGRGSPIRATNFAQDEVINYSERDGEEASSSRSYHPFDPPPEMMSIHPENIGIGSMYSNIVQELESSLNDVQNIRFRLGEMSDMLSNFSDRLENIMTQSNTILRNLSSSLDDLPVNEGDASNSQSQRPSQTSPDSASYSLEDIMPPSPSWIRTYRNPYAPNNPVNSDHTYPINPETTQNATLSPLHLSLQLTVTHIQRQARLLRQQVESIERIDRAMIEVAQLQMMRQMLDELHVHFGPNSSTDNRNGVSSVRQMMAGTRISDSTPYDSPSDEGTNNNSTNNNVDSQPSTSGAINPTNSETTSQNLPNTQTNRSRSRKNYPRCLFLMHRQYRRTGNSSLSARRNAAKDRVLLRRNIYRRFLPSRTTNRATVDVSSMRGRGYFNIFNPDTLPSMTRRLEYYLMEHCRFIGRSVIPPTLGSNTRSDVGEHVMTLRLNNCRMRMNRLMGNFQLESNNASVTADGTSRFAARQALSYTLDTITRFVEINPTTNISSTYLSQIWEVIELSLLLSELLLLQIVDSIPPPSGMNLDPERENLSMRIDQMCTRMIQSRLVGQSNQLTRSLRLMRLTVRHATQALGQTYTARRNAMLPTINDSERGDSRQGLLDDIHNCLRNIRRYRELTNDRPDDDSNFGDWYRTINDLISRYTSTNNNDGPSTSGQRLDDDNSSVLNNETGEVIRPPAVTVEDANSSDENSNNNDTASPIRATRRAIIPSSQDDDTEEERNWRSPNYLSVPIVQVNDVPIPDMSHSQQHPWRGRSNRQRLSERLDELRTGLLRPRFLHPLYSGVVVPFAIEDNLDEAHREPIYDSDVIPTVTPNHRIQVWEFSQGIIPNISNSQTNLVVNECKIHNDASVDYASDGSILVTLLPSGGYMNVTNRLGVYSLEWQTLGQCLYVTSFEQNAVSVSLSPTNRHLLVGLASRRVSILPMETWTMARIFLLDYRKTTHGNLASIRELEQNRDSNFMSLNCIRWLPTAGQGLIFGTNTGHLRLLT